MVLWYPAWVIFYSKGLVLYHVYPPFGTYAFIDLQSVGSVQLPLVYIFSLAFELAPPVGRPLYCVV